MNVDIHGRSFDVAAEPADYWGWVKNGRYRREFEIWDGALTPESTFLDLGAWVGCFSLYASRVARSVVAVEPDPVAFPILEINTLPVTNIFRHRLAITGRTGTVEMGSGWLGASTTRVNPDGGGVATRWAEGHTFVVECTTLREFAARLDDPLAIKMDVEGSEENILEDLDFFRERKPVVYIEKHPFWWRKGETGHQLIEGLKRILGSKLYL
jgi:FkbM family methyltransferase